VELQAGGDHQDRQGREARRRDELAPQRPAPVGRHLRARPASGLFTWWHANGQKALEGRYDQGKQDGPWTWWYATGQKSIHGEYAKGNPTGRWTWWKEDGKVAQSADLSHSEGVVIQELPGERPNVLPQVKRPVQRQPVRR
jgi:hypothetical protein